MESPDVPQPTSSRTAAIVVAAFVVAVLVIVVVLKAGGGSEEPVSWAIVESSDEGHTLRIAPLVALTACSGTPKVDLRKSNANRIDIAVSVKRTDCDGTDEGARAPAVIGVKLQQPLRGQQISGPKQMPPSAWPGVRAAKTLPSVVGFRLPDAKAILTAHRAELAGVVGPTVDATEVTSQAPPAGSTGSNDTGFTAAVRLRTVPR